MALCKFIATRTQHHFKHYYGGYIAVTDNRKPFYLCGNEKEHDNGNHKKYDYGYHNGNTKKF